MDSFVQKGKRVLVHCHAGMGRTAIICASYLVYCGKAKTGQEAINIVQTQRPGTLRNKLTAKNAAQSIIQFGEKVVLERKEIYPEVGSLNSVMEN